MSIKHDIKIPQDAKNAQKKAVAKEPVKKHHTAEEMKIVQTWLNHSKQHNLKNTSVDMGKKIP